MTTHRCTLHTLTKSHMHQRACMLQKRTECMQTRYSIRIANKAQLLKDVNGDSRLEKFPLFFLRLHKWLSCAHDSYLPNPFDNITYFVWTMLVLLFCWSFFHSGTYCSLWSQWFARFELRICFDHFNCHFAQTKKKKTIGFLFSRCARSLFFERFTELEYAPLTFTYSNKICMKICTNICNKVTVA